MGKNFKIVSTEKISVDTAWVPVYEEKSENRNHSNQLKVHMRETSSAGRKFEIVANSGLAIHFREK